MKMQEVLRQYYSHSKTTLRKILHVFLFMSSSTQAFIWYQEESIVVGTNANGASSPQKMKRPILLKNNIKFLKFKCEHFKTPIIIQFLGSASISSIPVSEILLLVQVNSYTCGKKQKSKSNTLAQNTLSYCIISYHGPLSMYSTYPQASVPTYGVGYHFEERGCGK